MSALKRMIAAGTILISCSTQGQEQAVPKAPEAKECKEEKTADMLAREKQVLIDFWKQNGLISNAAILDAFKIVPRENFTLPEFKNEVYLDRPLPILGGQTISQPTTVVLMLNAIDIQQDQKILEIGAGSGYNAAMLGTLVGAKGKVISTEIISELATFAQENLKNTGITNVTVLHTDGSKGFPKEAPFDRIIVTAGAPGIPLVFIDQLKEGGILLIPVDANSHQKMLRIKKEKGSLKIEELGEYRFVPLTGEYGKK